MFALTVSLAVVLCASGLFRIFPYKISTFSILYAMGSNNGHVVITDLAISFCSRNNPLAACVLDPRRWHRIEKDLYLHSAEQSAWLHVALVEEKELTLNDLVVADIRISDFKPSASSDSSWESRPGGMWVLKSNYTGDHHHTVTGVDVLFGVDAVDPRPQWSLQHLPLKLNTQPEVPVARLTIRHGKAAPRPDSPRIVLRAGENGKFKIVQISDTHMVTGVGMCKDASDAHGQPLFQIEADPLTVSFLEGILDIEKPDLVLLTGDQLHHDILDSQTAIFKVVAPLIERSIPYAAVFGNHDDEGAYALSRKVQMSLLQDLPFSLCQPGLDQVDGVGNYYLELLNYAPSELSLATLYLLDSHGEITSDVKSPDYSWITRSQIDWFISTSRALWKARKTDDLQHSFHLSLAFMHIPLPEYGDNNLVIKGGNRREPTEGPSFNSHFYDALVKEGVVAVGCGHDHVNDFCALRPEEESQQNEEELSHLGHWLCYGGGSGFGGYGSYDGKRYHRRTRIWEFDANSGGLKTWKRLEYAKERVDELVLVEGGTVVTPFLHKHGASSGVAAQVAFTA